MPAYMFSARSKRLRSVLLCVLVFVLSVTVYCGQKNGQTDQEETKTASNTVSRPLATIKSCALCGKPINAKTAGRLTLEVGKELNTCCGLCTAGIKKRIGQQHFDAVTVCYATGEKIDFKEAFFVVESDETPCCTPSVLAFVSMKEAETFVSSKNGRVITYKEALAYVNEIATNRK